VNKCNKSSVWNDKILFTPGPLTTSQTVKQLMLRDLGSRDRKFIKVVRDIRQRLVALGNVNESEYTAILMQGSGTFGIEAVISSVIPLDGKLLVLMNDAYGERILRMVDIKHRSSELYYHIILLSRSSQFRLPAILQSSE
jgi:2-aminoethylphosphonate-pyruvate transaminase